MLPAGLVYATLIQALDSARRVAAGDFFVGRQATKQRSSSTAMRLGNKQ